MLMRHKKHVQFRTLSMSYHGHPVRDWPRSCQRHALPFATLFRQSENAWAGSEHRRHRERR